jgi:hypothetical protein
MAAELEVFGLVNRTLPPHRASPERRIAARITAPDVRSGILSTSKSYFLAIFLAGLGNSLLRHKS